MSIISASTTSTTAYKVTADTTGTLVLQTGATPTTAVTFDANQNMGLGVTPSAWSGVKALEITSAGCGIYSFGTTDVRVTGNSYWNGSAYKYGSTNLASMYVQNSGVHYWYTAASGTAGNSISWTQAMTLDASGNLGIGTTSTTNYILRVNAASPLFGMMVSGTQAFTIGALSGGGGAFYYGAGNAEAARINSSGFFKATSDSSYYNINGGYHELTVNSNGNYAAVFTNKAATTPYGTVIQLSGATPNNTTQFFLSCDDFTNSKAIIYSSGTFGSRTSTYGGISDIKVKQDIVDAASQWNDIKALRFRKYRFKDDPTGPLQLGLISQEAELVSPGLVFETPDTERDEEGNQVETGEVTKSVKYSIVYMKAVVALQEAMTRIEEQQALITQLQADVAALKGNA